MSYDGVQTKLHTFGVYLSASVRQIELDGFQTYGKCRWEALHSVILRSGVGHSRERVLQNDLLIASCDKQEFVRY